MSNKIVFLPGDGIGPEVIAETRKILQFIQSKDNDFTVQSETYLVGGASIDKFGEPLRDKILRKTQEADAILLGAVGGPQWDNLPVDERPEKALLKLREECRLFANLRPVTVYPELVESSPLKNNVAKGADLMIVRELTGGIYFSDPRGIQSKKEGKEGINTLSYAKKEIERITDVAVEAARSRGNDESITSVDKANVLESSQVWRETVNEIVPEDVSLNHLYVDNAVMQLIGNPLQFDVIVTGNLFGDILSDAAAQISGSIGLLPSASLNSSNAGMYEPVHGSAPDIAGESIANPSAAVLSMAMAFRYSFNKPVWANRIEESVQKSIRDGVRTADIAKTQNDAVSTEKMGESILGNLKKLS